MSGERASGWERKVEGERGGRAGGELMGRRGGHDGASSRRVGSLG